MHAIVINLDMLPREQRVYIQGTTLEILLLLSGHRAQCPQVSSVFSTMHVPCEISAIVTRFIVIFAFLFLQSRLYIFLHFCLVTF